MSPADASFKLGSRGTGLKIDLYGLNKRSVMERLRAPGVGTKNSRKGDQHEVTRNCSDIGRRAVAVSSAYAQYYGPGYYSGYAYSGPSYAYVAPTYPYADPPAYGYVYAPPPTCWNSTSDSRNFGYYGSCAYGAIDTDAEALGQARPNKRLVR